MKCFQSERSSRQSLQFLRPTHQNFSFTSVSGRFGRIFCLFFMARRQFPHRRFALAASFRVRRPPNAPFVLSCPPDTPRLQCGCRRRHTGFPSASSRSRQFRAHSTPIPSSIKKTQATFSSKKAQETLEISSSIFLVAAEVEPLNKRLSEVHSSANRFKSDSRCP